MNAPASPAEPIRQLLAQNDAWRRKTLNLIASENVLSPTVRAALDNDLIGRYADYTGHDLAARRYRGTRYIAELEQVVAELACRVFQAQWVELRPISGHLAGAAVLMALCRPGDVVLELDGPSGGHREASKFNLPSLAALDVRFLPFDGERYNVDVPATAALIAAVKPRVVILGTSNFLFPHPMRALKTALQATNPQSYLIYDASHVMGFLAARRFQDPLAEGADVVFGSTHKTLPGPQGGLIFSNRQDLLEPITEAVYPALVTNHHAFRLPALGLALAEMETFGAAYADQIVANAQALGAGLEANGVPCVKVDGRYSCSHTLLARVGGLGPGAAMAQRLEAADIIVTGGGIPAAQGGEGLRLGVQEVTRRGATEATMLQAGGLIADALLERRPAAVVAGDVHAVMTGLGPLRYTWDAPC